MGRGGVGRATQVLALAELPGPVEVREQQGWRDVLAGLVIDLATRWRGPER